MATFNFFSLLEDEESDASAVIERAAAVDKRESKKHHPPTPAAPPGSQQQQQAPVKLPSRPLPPAQAVKESRFGQSDSGRGRGGRGGGRGSYGNRDRERDGGFIRPVRDEGFQGDRDSYDNRNNSYNRDGNDFQGRRGGYYGRGGAAPFGGYGNGPSMGEDAEGGQRFEGSRGRSRGRGRARGYGRGYGRGGFGDVIDGEEPQQGRDYERRSGTGRGNDFKINGSGRGNWGIETEQDAPAPQETADATTVEEEKQVTDVVEKPLNEIVEQQPAEVINAETATIEEKKEEEEDNEMLLDDYMKVLEEKRKSLQSLKPEGRKVVADKDFERMQLVRKKQDEEISVKLGSEKDKGKKKETIDRDDKAKKSVNINEFLRPTEGEDYYSIANRRGRGRGRGRGDRGGYKGGFGGSYSTSARQDLAPRIEDPGQFPILGAK